MLIAISTPNSRMVLLIIYTIQSVIGNTISSLAELNRILAVLVVFVFYIIWETVSSTTYMTIEFMAVF